MHTFSNPVQSYASSKSPLLYSTRLGKQWQSAEHPLSSRAGVTSCEGQANEHRKEELGWSLAGKPPSKWFWVTKALEAKNMTCRRVISGRRINNLYENLKNKKGFVWVQYVCFKHFETMNLAFLTGTFFTAESSATFLKGQNWSLTHFFAVGPIF